MKEYYHSKEALVQYLISNIPKYKEYYEKEKKEWEENKITYHTEMRWLLDFTDNEIEHDNVKHLPFIFGLIEELIECGDENTDNAVWTMFLECIPEKPRDRFPKFSVEACHKYLGPKSLKALEIINAPLDPEIVLQREKENQYKASIIPFMLESLNNKIEGYSKFREEDIKKWKEEGQIRPLSVEMVTVLEFVKTKLANNDQQTINKILETVKETAEYAKNDLDSQKLLEHWYNILEKQQ